MAVIARTGIISLRVDNSKSLHLSLYQPKDYSRCSGMAYPNIFRSEATVLNNYTYILYSPCNVYMQTMRNLFFFAQQHWSVLL